MAFDAGSDFWQLLGAAIVGLGTGGVIVLTRLPVTALSRSIRGFAACASLWALGDLITSLASTLFWKEVGLAILYTGVLFLPPLWWRMALQWAEERGSRVSLDSPLWTRLPFVFAGVMWLVMVTNPWHGAFLTPVVGGHNIYQPLWYLGAIPSYGLIVGGLVVETRVLLRGTTGARRQSAFVISAGLCTLLANFLDVLDLTSGTSATIPMLAISGVILITGMVREGLFGVMPMALPLIASRDPDGLVVVNPDGGILYANVRARVLLAPVSLDAGTPLLDRIAPHLLEVDGTPVARSGLDWDQLSWRTGLRDEGALYRYGNEGARWLRIGTERVSSRTKRLLAHCLRIHDATEEQRAEVEVRRARRLESVAELALGVAHDFNNLLMVVRGNTELLARELPPDPELQHRIDRIRSAGKQAVTLAQQLQLYAGAMKPARSSFDLNEFVSEMVDGLGPELFSSPEERAPDLELDLAPRALRLEADAAQLQQLFLNLLVNAGDALAGEGGEIGVATGARWLEPSRVERLVVGADERPGHYVLLRVSDTGCGMDPSTQERIFEPFFSTKGKQRGIGLSTVLGIVRSHDALLELESRVGEGTVFTVYLPAAEVGEGAR